MSKKIVYCKVQDEYVIGQDVSIGAAGAAQDTALSLEFNEHWKGLTKSITFVDALGENPKSVLLLDTMLVHGTLDTYLVSIPAEATAIAGKMMCAIQGGETTEVTENGEVVVKFTKIAKSAAATFRVLPSVDIAVNDELIEPSTAEQLATAINAVTNDAEAWAVGTRNGVAVESADAAYENSAKYHAQQAAASDAAAEASAQAAASSALSVANLAIAAGEFASAAEASSGLAAQSASSANSAMESALSSAENAEAWAVGKRNGTDVGSSDETYHNNAKYYTEQALAVLEDYATAIRAVLSLI